MQAVHAAVLAKSQYYRVLLHSLHGGTKLHHHFRDIARHGRCRRPLRLSLLTPFTLLLHLPLSPLSYRLLLSISMPQTAPERAALLIVAGANDIGHSIQRHSGRQGGDDIQVLYQRHEPWHHLHPKWLVLCHCRGHQLGGERIGFQQRNSGAPIVVMSLLADPSP